MDKKTIQHTIKYLKKVCDSCGRKLQVICLNENGRKDYVVGCYHGSKGSRGTITNGVPIGVYRTAVKLVLDDCYNFGIKKGDNFEYEFMCAVKKACDIISKVEYMKDYQSHRYTKKQLEENFNLRNKK